MPYNDKIYVVGPLEVLQELYPDYVGNDVIEHEDNSVYEIRAEKVITDPRVRNLTHAEILKETDKIENEDE